MGAGKYTYSLADAGVPIVHVSGPLTPSADCPAWSSGTYRFDGGEEQPITLGTGYFRDIEVPPLMREGGHTLAITCWGANVGGGPEFHQESLEVVVDNTPPSMTITKPADWAILPGKAGSVTYGGAISDNNEDPRVSLYQFALWATTPDRIYPFPYVVATGAGAWSFQFPMVDIPGFSLPGSYHLQSYFEAKDGAGNALTSWVCPGPAHCRQDESLRRDLIIDGTPPQVWIDTPSENAVVSSLAAISGTADDQSETGWGTQLKRVLLELRRNSTGETIISADIPVSGSTAAWSHPVNDQALTHLSSYTIVVRAEDAMENMSAPVERVFTFDLCSPNPPPVPGGMTTISGVLERRPGTNVKCFVMVCGRSTLVDAGADDYLVLDVPTRQMRVEVKAVCEDDDVRCPQPLGERRTDIRSGGFWDLRWDSAKRTWRRHQGVDYKFRSSDPADKIIESATSSQVIYVGEVNYGDAGRTDNTWGWTVWTKSLRTVNIEGTDYFEYVVYAHLAPPSPATPVRVRIGDGVSAGQPIADGDKTGYGGNIQEHVHAEVFYSNANLQPLFQGILEPALNQGKGWKYFGDHRLGLLGGARKGNADSIFGCGKYPGRPRMQP